MHNNKMGKHIYTKDNIAEYGSTIHSNEYGFQIRPVWVNKPYKIPLIHHR